MSDIVEFNNIALFVFFYDDVTVCAWFDFGLTKEDLYIEEHERG